MKIVTLTLSSAFDIHCNAERIEVNHENLATITDYDAGGKGVNISRALSSFGTESEAVVVLGEENGDSFARALASDGISYHPIWEKGRIRENITIHTADGNETRISFKGTSASADLLTRVENTTDNLASRGTILTLTGRVPDGVSLSDVKSYVKRLSERGVKVVIDSRSFTLDDLIETRPFLIKPNEEEIAAYMGRAVQTPEAAAEAGRELCNAGIENVMISLGAKGAVLVTRDATYHAPAPKIKPISTIGAGDSSIAGFLHALAGGMEFEAALRVAVAFGSAACLTPGTRPPKVADVEKFLKN